MSDAPGQAELHLAARGARGRLARLALKELRETLRDRRTIVTLLLMPVLVYPLLSVAFQKLLVSSFGPPTESHFRVVFANENDSVEVARMLNEGEIVLRRAADPDFSGNALLPIKYYLAEDLEEEVRAMNADLGIRVSRPEGEASNRMPNLDLELIYDATTAQGAGKAAAEFVEERVRAINRLAAEFRLRRLGFRGRAMPLAATRTALRSQDGPAFSLATLVPLILILMTITGAVYPAIDLTAGERERGTLETLVAAPVPRLGLLLAKYAAVLTVALLTATVNLTAMAITVLSIGLGPHLFGEEGLTFTVVVQVFGLLTLFAAFFSAILLAVTSFARSFKEAQAYLIPLMLVAIAPGLLSMMPGLELEGYLEVIPLVNIVLLARDLFQQQADLVTSLVVVVSTAMYALAALAAAARIFGTDAILYGSQGAWSDLFRRPDRPQAAPSLTSALFCLALMFPPYFVLGNLLGRMQGATLGQRLAVMSAITAALFFVFPLVAAWLNRVRVTAAMRLRPAPLLSFLAAALLGLSLWTFCHEIVLAEHWAGLVRIDEALEQQVAQMMAQWRELSPVWILVTLAVVPAVFEEFFFRGYLFSALRDRTSPRNTILLTAILFGLFHIFPPGTVTIERLVPSTLLGLVLGWLCYRTGSILPGILLHFCNNGLLVMVAYYQPQLADQGLGVEEREHLPYTWLLAAAATVAVGALLAVLATRRETSKPEAIGGGATRTEAGV